MTTPADLPFSLDRDVLVRAPRALVFRFFTDSDRWADWWGAGSTIEGRVGGALRIVYPNAITASGEVLELVPDERIVFTFGYDSGTPIPPGGSRVTLALEDDPRGTRVLLTHHVASAEVREPHVQGWRYQLALFANAVANHVHAGAQDTVDRWFAAWSAEPDALEAALADLLTDDATFQDAHSCLRGPEDIRAHVAAARMHMPGITMARSGPARHCQGTVLADWSAAGPDGAVVAGGTNVFELAPDGRLARVIGVWSPPTPGDA